MQTLRRRLFNRPTRFRRLSILYAPICSLARQFVALFIPQQQLFCPMPHCFRKQANLYCSTRFIRPTRLSAPGNFADPAPFKSRKRGRGFNRCICPSEAVRQRSVRPYDTADTAGKLSTREDLPPAIPATGLIGFIESFNNFSADFPRHLNFRNRRGKRHCLPLPPEQNAAKRHFTENERPDILNRTVPRPVYRSNVRQAAKNPSAHRRKQSLLVS